MENYNLDKDEVVLYKGNITTNKPGVTNIILTNKNFVFINNRDITNKDEAEVETYSVNEIKIYKEIPQIIKNGTKIELYFFDKEVEFYFSSKTETNKFTSIAFNLLTGKTRFERSLNKIKNTIDAVDNTFEINSKEIVASTVKSGVLNKTVKTIGLGVTSVGKGLKSLLPKKK